MRDPCTGWADAPPALHAPTVWGLRLRDQGLIPASSYDKYSVRPSTRPIYTRCCFVMSHVIQLCSNLVEPERLSKILARMRFRLSAFRFQVSSFENCHPTQTSGTSFGRGCKRWLQRCKILASIVHTLLVCEITWLFMIARKQPRKRSRTGYSQATRQDAIRQNRFEPYLINLYELDYRKGISKWNIELELRWRIRLRANREHLEFKDLHLEAKAIIWP